MKTYKFILLIVAVVLSIKGISQEKFSQSGLKYTLVMSGNEEIPDSNRVVIRFKYMDSKGELKGENISSERPSIIPKSFLRSQKNNLYEIMYELKDGDSISTKMTIQQILNTVPEGEDLEEEWTVHLKITGSISPQEYKAYRKQQIIDMRPEDDKDGMKQLATDIALIERYLKDYKIEALKTQSGLFYSITTSGKGDTVKKGDTIRANYTGYLLETGFHFDTSIEEVAKQHNLYYPEGSYEPYKTVIGEGKVIDGWDEAFQLLNQGTKATLLIPSMLAYGPRKLSEDIPANSVMIFEVELVEIIKN